MKWIIKNPAPTDWRQEKWGDFHFGRSLTKYLERLEVNVETDYYPHWDNRKKADVVFVLRGKYPYRPKPGAFHIMWNISHPSSVSLEEYESYDLIFVASKKHANYIRSKISKPVYPLIQCTDHEEFYVSDPKLDRFRKDIIFVGNCKGVQRPGIIWATELGLPIKIWGRGWEQFIDPSFIQGEYIDNKELGALYSKSKVILNDHYDDMKQFGFINNRIFDALSCGLPVISDYHEELHQLFPTEILYYKNKKEFLQAVETVIFQYPKLKANVDRIQPKIHEEHSFQARAKIILDIYHQELKTAR
ncbi:hypothetical protein BKP37_16510 [Anaerobacillus alkalilacustris]|uniref:Spore protein YkvP/CgeB glycosyl transferase-like domain-containing protein n=1 Tax=Anaerobacillus alkalilacustris TaxID=393763 RepID=A0A1S2LID8_9BACI|nr:glycosyltransferase [Anaerobacillus alkalilacustris]OIJ11245.1 hypothetical protein BKP37_16510 [Anaerobacillus alkalilacustris]